MASEITILKRTENNMSGREELKYITGIIDRGGPRGPAEMAQVIRSIARLSDALKTLEAQETSPEVIAELRSVNEQLSASVATLEAAAAEKAKETRVLKTQITKLKKKQESNE